MNTYQSKFGVGETVWLIHKNKAVTRDVVEVNITSKVVSPELTQTVIVYSFWFVNDKAGRAVLERYYEEDCFATKEELLGSL